MKVLLDECVDWRLSQDIIGHEVKTAHEMGWTAVTNGDLLALASKTFDVFVTVDRNIAFQQNLVGVSIAVIVLHAKTNRLVDLKKLVSRLIIAIEAAQPEKVVVVGEN